MNCLECRKPIEGGKYCSERCGNAYRVRMHRLKVSSDILGAPVEEKEPTPKPEGVQGTVGLDPRLKNTIHDPSPDWNPERVITEDNKRMVCPICNKLSLTHLRMCSVRNGDRVVVYGN